VTAQPTASQVKHERLVRWLTNKITMSMNRPHFTQQDVRKAIDRYKTRQKRVNLELEKQQALQQMRDK
jgi:predicted ATP-dependent protease